MKNLSTLLLTLIVACGVGVGQQIGQVAAQAQGGRTCLAADVVYHVSDGGSDTGGDGSSGNPWKTPQRAYEFVRDHIDLCGKTATVQLPPALTDQANILQGRLVGAIGARSFIISGDIGNPAAFVISTTTGAALFRVDNGAEITVQGATLSSSSGAGLVAGGGTIRFGFVVFNNMVAAHLDAASPQSRISAFGNYTIAGTGTVCSIHAVAEDHAQINLAVQVTLSGSPAWTTFVQGDLGGMIDATGFSFAGNGSGQRYNATLNGIVFTGGANGQQTFFPGSQPGITGTGGVYF